MKLIVWITLTLAPLLLANESESALPLDQTATLIPVLTPSVNSPVPVGSLITWTATLPGSQPGTLWYRFIVREFDQPHKIYKDFGPDNSFRWSPTEREGYYTVEVAVRNQNTGQEWETVVPFQVTSNVTGGQPVLKPTSHPLVFLYSAPPCPVGDTMLVYFLNPQTNTLQNTPPKRCDGIFSFNFYIAGLRGSTFYYVRHHVNDNGALTEGPLLSFTSGPLPADLPQVTKISQPANTSSEPVLLAASLFTK